MTSALTLVALLLSGGLYFWLAARSFRQARHLGDHIPMIPDSQHAQVRNANEFSAATTAVTISLATLVLAYAELASWAGLWLLWTVVTTAAGILAIRIAAPRIWRRLSVPLAHRPTLHEFLGSSFRSSTLARSAAICTSLGFLGALATELTVGSRFLATLVPEVPAWSTTVILAAIGVGYTMLGGFRSVVVTDRVQMAAIWAAIFGLGALVWLQASETGGISQLISRLPVETYDFSWREGMGAFLVGIFIINVPTFLADMSIWQRIAASTSEDTIKRGLSGSVFAVAGSWTLLVVIACALVAVAPVVDGQNPLASFLLMIHPEGKILLALLFLLAVTGLYAANLSTASTQLIATAHTLHTDLMRYGEDRTELANSSKELLIARVVLLVAAVSAILIVEGLRLAGFSIADLVFAIFGAQLGMVPAVLLALFADQESIKRLGIWASVAVFGGFLAGWATAACGKIIGDGNLVFLSPAASLVFSATVLAIGRVMTRSP